MLTVYAMSAAAAQTLRSAAFLAAASAILAARCALTRARAAGEQGCGWPALFSFAVFIFFPVVVGWLGFVSSPLLNI